MSQLLRLRRYARPFLASASYTTGLSGAVRQALKELQHCHKCHAIRSSGQDVFTSCLRNSRSYSSVIPRIKPDGRHTVSKSQWKKKKTKTSKINTKIHAELLAVLNKRAVQLLLDREEHQLQRTLVTNFSFMDFPLLTSPENPSVSEIKLHRPKLLSMHRPITEAKPVSDSWESQFSNFHSQLEKLVDRTAQGNTVGKFDHLRKTGVEALSVDAITKQKHEEKVADQFVSSVERISTGTLKHDPSIPFIDTQTSPATRTQDPKPSVTRPSVNANIFKTKQIGKPHKLQSGSVRQASATAPLPLEEDMLEEAEAEVMASEEDAVMGDVDLVQGPTKTELKQLQKVRADLEKFQADPAKFNLIFNQELLAYVDACCFAGLESVAHNFLNIFHQRRTSELKNSGNSGHKRKTLTNMKDAPEMRQIQDISIYNRLLQTWAKKNQWGQIEKLFSMLRSDDLKPNMQSYAACLECLGHQRNVDMSAGEKLLTDMQNEGLDVKEIFNSCVFYRDEQQFILKALKALDPGYEPNPPPAPLPPSGPLVENLNTAWLKDQVIEKNPYAGIVPTSELRKLAPTQLQREIRGTVTFKSILKQPPPNKRTQEYRKKLESVREEWKGLLTKAVERKVRYLARRSKMDYSLTLYPFLKLFEPQEYAQCLMQEIEALASSSDTFSPNKMYLWKQLSTRIQQKFIMMEKIRNKVPKKVGHLYEEYIDEYNDPDFDLDSHRQQWQRIVAQTAEGPSLDTAQKVWPNHILLALGKLLYDMILYDLKVDANILKGQHFEKKLVPAFYTIYRNYAFQTFEEIKPHPVLVQLYKGAEISELTFDAGLLPMLVPPIPWVSTSHGGYLLNSVNLVRLPLFAQVVADKSRDKEAVSSTQFAGVLDSINTLSACAWTINKQVLDVIIEMFNNKGDASLDIPPPASECPPPPKITVAMTPQEKAQVQKQRQKLSQQRAEMHSLWCTELYKLSIANKFRDEVLWFPHNLDFRGRTYPCPPHFNHLGSDVTRSILMFARGKPLGPKGLDWMKIHLINLTGFKKRNPNRERLVYANEMMPEIFDSADNPLTGNKWWQKSDEPWQTLACCMEITKAVRSPDPEQYVCHLPIHQDGSCNGLQHYAALGRDKAGAQSVNLWPYDRPQDVYSDVCELVEKERQKDAAEGVHIAKVLEGFVRRKVIKQTVMTTVYGVTRYGAKAQILRQLKDIPEFPQAHVWAGSRYLTEKTFQCLNEMFSATKNIQDWLTLSAQLIATVCQRPVEWVTPLGLPVIQPYHKPLITTRFGVHSVDRWNCFEKPNAMKQKNAFPPNYIHSLDSTHMMLTALYCMRAGITFVSVHDCFWTHACDVEIMNKICRQQFVALHKQPLLEDLSSQLIQTYTPMTNSSQEKEEIHITKLRSVLANVPARGDFDLDKVLESTYFFS